MSTISHFVDFIFHISEILYFSAFVFQRSPNLAIFHIFPIFIEQIIIVSILISEEPISRHKEE